MASNFGIDEGLRRRVKLERLYDYSEQYNLSFEGRSFDAYHLDGKIFLDAELGWRAVPIYLHEVAHAIARISGFDTSPNAAAHNQYFAVLVAVMYRRTRMLHQLSVYDFCDTEQGQTTLLENAPVLSNAELMRRFRYIMLRSAQLAKTNLTIEQIAGVIFQEDAWQHWSSGEPPTAAAEKHSRLLDIAMGALGGGIVATAALAAVSTLF